MTTINELLGWMFSALAAMFLLGLTQRFARRFYPASPGFQIRLIAPAIFGILSAACFAGASLHALVVVVIFGLTQIILGRSRQAKCPRQRPIKIR